MPSFDLFHKQRNVDDSSVASDVDEQVGNEEEVVESSSVVQDDTVVVDGGSGDGCGVSVGEENVVGDSPFDDVEGLREFAFDKMMYLKAMPLRDTLDLEGIKAEVKDGNILILRITPLASKSVEAVKSAVNELYVFTESIGGDIARLGEERVVICPKKVRIWREKR